MFNILNCALALGIASCVALYPSSSNIDKPKEAVNLTNLDFYNKPAGLYDSNSLLLRSDDNFTQTFTIDCSFTAQRYSRAISGQSGYNFSLFNNEILHFSVGSSSIASDTLLYFTTFDGNQGSLLEEAGVTSTIYIYLNNNLPYNFGASSLRFNITLFDSVYNTAGVGTTSFITLDFTTLSYLSFIEEYTYQSVVFRKYSLDVSRLDYNGFLANYDYTDILDVVTTNYSKRYYYIFSLSLLSSDESTVTYDSGYKDGYESGYNVGKNVGLQEGASAHGLFFSIADTPIVMLRSLFNFEFFGMNFFVIMMSLLTLLLVLFVIKKIK